MFGLTTEGKTNLKIQEAWQSGYESGTGKWNSEFHNAADRVALEASRRAPETAAATYIETYSAVLDALVKKHGK